MSDFATWLQLVGAVSGFAGALCLGYAQQGIADYGAHVQLDAQGQRGRVSAMVFLEHPRMWRWGFVLLCIGFVLQFIGYFVVLMGGTR